MSITVKELRALVPFDESHELSTEKVHVFVIRKQLPHEDMMRFREVLVSNGLKAIVVCGIGLEIFSTEESPKNKHTWTDTEVTNG